MLPSIKNKIKSIRELRNYTQEYMAQRLGMTQAGYSKIETGKTDLSYANLQKIAHILEVRIEDIIRFDSQRYFNNYHNTKDSFNRNTNTSNSSNTEKNLYEDKILLLEKLLKKTDSELKRYQEKYGVL